MSRRLGTGNLEGSWRGITDVPPLSYITIRLTPARVPRGSSPSPSLPRARVRAITCELCSSAHYG